MTDIYIISGFLGAGKTTLIQTMVRTVFQDQKVVVIENDFGEAGIDASLL
ncbi:MAG: GTP-binding protein, partial [Lacrimispora sp.]